MQTIPEIRTPRDIKPKKTDITILSYYSVV